MIATSSEFVSPKRGDPEPAVQRRVLGSRLLFCDFLVGGPSDVRRDEIANERSLDAQLVVPRPADLILLIVNMRSLERVGADHGKVAELAFVKFLS
jgi:hypothetical protein